MAHGTRKQQLAKKEDEHLKSRSTICRCRFLLVVGDGDDVPGKGFPIPRCFRKQ